jgi:hypothetical protein
VHNQDRVEAGLTFTDVSLVLQVEDLARQAPILAAKLARLDPQQLASLLASPIEETRGGPGSPAPDFEPLGVDPPI